MPTSTASPFDGCGEGWDRFDSECYKFVTFSHGGVNWNTAQRDCQGGGGGRIENLAFLSDVDIGRFSEFMNKQNQLVGRPDYQWWVGASIGDCAVLTWIDPANPVLKTKSCSPMHWYICERPPLGLGCGAGWDRFGSECYKFVTFNHGGVNWNTAQRDCQGGGGGRIENLASLSDVNIGRFSEFLSKKNQLVGRPHYQWWVGASIGDCAVLTWTDPANPVLRIKSCSAMHWYICERPPLVTESTGGCPGANGQFVENNGNCFYFSSDSPLGKEVGWQEARESCKQLGKDLRRTIDLAELESSSDEWLMGQLQLKDNKMWIGGYDPSHGDRGWIWVHSGRAISLANTFWAPNEPNHTGGDEWCLNSQGYGDQNPRRHYINDEPCSCSMGYVCQVFQDK